MHSNLHLQKNSMNFFFFFVCFLSPLLIHWKILGSMFRVFISVIYNSEFLKKIAEKFTNTSPFGWKSEWHFPSKIGGAMYILRGIMLFCLKT